MAARTSSRPVKTFTVSFPGHAAYDEATAGNPLKGSSRHLIHVDEALLFFLHQILHRLINAHLPSLRAALKHIAQHVFHVDAHLFDALWPGQLNYRKALFAHVDLDDAIIKFATA